MRWWAGKKTSHKELLEKNEKLRKISAEQQKRIDMLEHENTEHNKHIENFKQLLLQLQTENEELRQRLEKGNPDPPSTPSGMKPVYKKPNKKRGRKKPGRKKGHPGTRRPKPDRVDETVDHELTHCPDCSGSLPENPSEIRTRYTEDIPPVHTTVTEHRIHRYWCACCSKIVEPPIDAALPRMQIGIRLLIMTAFMHYFMGVTISNIRTWMSTFASFEISPGGLTSAWKRLAGWLSPLYEQIAQQVRSSEVLHADETGWRVAGRTWWLWCFTNIRLVYYIIAPSRGSPVVAAVLGEMFPGILVSDFFGAYNLICAAEKQRCLAHLFRELKKVLEKNNSHEWVAFCKKLKRLLHDAMRLSKRGGAMPTAEFAGRRTRLTLRLEALYSVDYTDQDCRRLAKRLSRHKDEIFTFVDHPDVPADNNHAERQIRPPVIIRKNSYCNRSVEGAETQAILMSLFRTLHLRDLDAVETLCASIKSSLTSGELLPLPQT